MRGGSEARDAHLMTQQINPEKIKVLGARDQPSAAATSVPEVSVAPKMLACAALNADVHGSFPAATLARTNSSCARLTSTPGCRNSGLPLLAGLAACDVWFVSVAAKQTGVSAVRIAATMP